MPKVTALLPRTLTPGQPENVADVQLNDAHLRDSINALDSTPADRARVSVAAFSVPAAYAGAVTFTTEEEDNAGLFDLATQPTRLTAARSGVYHVHAAADWGNGASGRHRKLTFFKNGSTYIAGTLGANTPDVFANYAVFVQTLSLWVQLAAGEYLQVFPNHGDGGAWNVAVQFGMMRVSAF